MKVVLSILLLLSEVINSQCPCTCTLPIKNIQPVDQYPLYSAFGFVDSSRSNILTYYYRIGTGHLTGGNQYYREYNISSNTWYDTVRISTGTKDARDIYGTRMDNDSTMMFLTRSNNGAGGDWAIDIQIIKCDSNNHFSAPVDFDWSVIPVRLTRSWPFGHTVKSDTAGIYYQAFVQITTTGSRRSRISILKTTDYWNTYHEVGIVYDGPTSYSETTLANLGAGNFLALMRNDLSGSLTGYESSNACVKWTARVSSNLFWWISAGTEMSCIDTHDGVFDIIFECRDANYIMISRDNNISENFGTANYKTPELYAYNFGTGGNPSLGYPVIRSMGADDHLIVYSYQVNNSIARLMWTRDNLFVDPNGMPSVPPIINSSFITASSFRIDIAGYTQAQLDNIRYFVQDVSTDSLFNTFTTLKYRTPTSIYPAVKMQNIRTMALWDTYNGAVTQTDYYIRIRACNNKGCSIYSTTKLKTL